MELHQFAAHGLFAAPPAEQLPSPGDGAPRVFVFNPLTEARLAGGKSFSPTKHQAQLVRDLTNLPQFLCRPEDIVLVERRPSGPFLSGLKEAGVTLPEFTDSIVSLAERKLGALRPWAWGPDSIELFQPLFPNLTEPQRAAEVCFNDRLAALYSKAWSAAFLRKFLHSHDRGQPEKSPFLLPVVNQSLRPAAATPKSRWLCSAAEVGVAVNSVAAALEAIAAIRSRGHHKIVLKEAIGVAGRNALRLFEPEVLETQTRWLE